MNPADAGALAMISSSGNIPVTVRKPAWDGASRQKLLGVLESAGARAWRFLSLTGLLDRALPELGEALARRQAAGLSTVRYRGRGGSGERAG